ncbi:MAG: cupin domain-containing protein [Deltaproteobacteria bacterium]|nr:cupin domain-containing protein [Deltaproteobacteria bacterium]MBW2298130.1 cupin domain-containing protein [Deltaproteobacteria bacterium]
MENKDSKPPINVDYFEDLTGEISKTDETQVESVGERLNVLRKEKGISLEELSRMTGFDVDFLEDIELDRVKPQLGTSIRLSKALDSAFGRIVSGQGSKLYSVTRKDEKVKISRSTSKKGKKEVYTYMSLAPDVKGRNMEALIVELKENPDEEMSVHAGEEFIYVLKGVVSLQIGTDTFALEPGDSVYYLSTTPHLIAAQQGEATILAVVYSQ